MRGKKFGEYFSLEIYKKKKNIQRQMTLSIRVCLDFLTIEQRPPLYGIFGNAPQNISNVQISHFCTKCSLKSIQ